MALMSSWISCFTRLQSRTILLTLTRLKSSPMIMSHLEDSQVERILPSQGHRKLPLNPKRQHRPIKTMNPQQHCRPNSVISTLCTSYLLPHTRQLKTIRQPLRHGHQLLINRQISSLTSGGSLTSQELEAENTLKIVIILISCRRTYGS